MSRVAEWSGGSGAGSGTPIGVSSEYNTIQERFSATKTEFYRPMSRTVNHDPIVQDLVDELNSFTELQEDWDGEESLPVSPDALASAKFLIDLAVQETKFRGIAWVAPSASPTPDGGIALTWDHAGHRLMLIFEGESDAVVCVIKNGHFRPVRQIVPFWNAIEGAALAMSGR